MLYFPRPNKKKTPKKNGNKRSAIYAINYFTDVNLNHNILKLMFQKCKGTGPKAMHPVNMMNLYRLSLSKNKKNTPTPSQCIPKNVWYILFLGKVAVYLFINASFLDELVKSISFIEINKCLFTQHCYDRHLNIVNVISFTYVFLRKKTLT